MSTRIKQVRLTTEELHQLKWLLGGVLSLLSLWALSSLEMESGLWLIVGCVAALFALISPRRVAAIPEVIWRFMGPIILVVAVVDFSLGSSNFFAPLMRLVILLLIYRSLAPRTRREDLQLVLLCLFSLVVSGALTVSLLFAAQILLFTPVAMAMLFVICLLDRGAQAAPYQPDWTHFSWGRLVSRAWSVIDIRVLCLGSLLFAFVVAASTGFFVLIPRFNLEQAIPFLQLPSKPKSGFSDSVQLGSVSEITEDHSIALRIDVPSLEAIHSTPYWRILVLDRYHDGAFRLSDNMRGFRQLARRRELHAWDEWEVPLRQRKAQQWTFYFEGGVSQYLPLAGAFYSMRFPTKQDLVMLADMHIIGLRQVPQSTFSYQLEDLILDIWAPASEAENNAFTEFTNHPEKVQTSERSERYPYTNLELTLEAKDRAHLSTLNSTLIGDSRNLSAADYSQIVTRHLRQNFSYSLHANGASGAGDPVVNWLTTGSLGHCELFAGAFVLLARDAGYPARMAVGFAGGGWNAVEDFFVVRNSDAHAWVEIYDAHTQQWLRVDPTPGANPNNPEVTLPVSFEIETGMSAWVDSLRMQWYRRIVNFDQTDQLELASSMIDLGDDLIARISTRLKSLSASLKEWITRPFGRDSLVRTGALICVGIGGFVLWRMRDLLLQLLFHLLRRPQKLNPIRREASRILMRVRTRITELDSGDPQVLALREVQSELKALRFGPDVTSEIAKAVFSRSKRVLKQTRT